MAGDDRDSRTEEPTEKKLSDAAEKGNVALSREAVLFVSLLGLLVVLRFPITWTVGELSLTLGGLLGGAGRLALGERGDSLNLLLRAAIEVAWALLPVLAIIAVAGVAGSLFQNLPQANLERIRPKFERISPMAGFRRIFGLVGAIEFLKTTLKLAAVITVAVLAVKSEIVPMLSQIEVDPLLIPQSVLGLAYRITLTLVVFSLVLAAADFAWARYKWRRDLRMTRQEIKDEHKQQEGDPFIKMRVRGAARRMSQRRMMSRLPSATMVIANPTHYAVALRYVRQEGGAPVVIAKGIDHLALRIRQRAEGLEIPVIENKPLARALYEKTEIDDAIPEEFYKAVAELIHFLQVRNRHGVLAPARP